MPSLIHAPAGGPIVWPYSEAQLLADNPNVSFRVNPSAEDIAPFDAFWVTDTEQPASDPRSERVEEVEPAYDENSWRQQWRIRAATPEEVAVYDELNRPPPNWPAFQAELLQSATFAAARIGARQIVESELPTAEGVRRQRLLRASTALSAIDAAVLGAANDQEPFITAWLYLRQARLVSLEVATGMTQIASACSLPLGLIRALGAPEQ